MIHALVHTVGIFFQNQFIILEVAYSDILGSHYTFLVNSPYSFNTIKILEPRLPIPILITEKNGVPLSTVQSFLKERYHHLKSLYPNVMFGRKGTTFQTQILQDIPNINIESLFEGLPNINRLKKMYPNIENICPYHKHKGGHCAYYVVRLLEEASNLFSRSNSNTFL